MTRTREDPLALATRHVAEGKQCVANQVALVARLAKNGHDTTAAKALLATFEQTLALMIQDQQRIVDAQSGNA